MLPVYNSLEKILTFTFTLHYNWSLEMLLVLNNILNIGITGITGKDLASKIIALLSDIFVCIKLQPTTHNTHVALLLLLENFLLLTTYE